MTGSTTTTGCLETEAVLSFLEGRASEAERARIEAHAAGCTACRELLSALADTADREAPTGPRGPEAEALAPGARVGRYVVLEREAEGAMGIVYSAHDPELERKVALKIPRPRRALASRLRREAQALARLQHPNVVAAYDVGTVGDQIFVAMEYVEGETLSAWLARAERPWREVLDRFIDAGRGLAAAHAAGLVHRDFKPDNVLLGADGRVRVADFGLARAPASGAGGEGGGAPSSGVATLLTQEGTLLGTPAFMAPEQHRGEEADAKSDQFSFCVALYFGLYGYRPFSGGTWEALREAMASGRVPDPPRGSTVPRHLHRTLARGLSIAPEDRFPTMNALIAALARDPWRRPRRIALAAAALALVIATAAAAQHFTDAGRVCRSAGDRLAGVWDAPRRRAIESGLRATGQRYAASSFERVAEALDAYTHRWVQMRTEACEATRIRGEQSDELLGRRMACLDARLRDVRALGDRLIEADRATLDNAVQAAQRLPDLSACGPTAASLAVSCPPPEPARAREVEAVAVELGRAGSLEAVGRYADGLAAARAIAEKAEAIGDRPLEAEASARLGGLAEKMGDLDLAEKSLDRALWTAEAARCDRIAAETWIRLIGVIGHDRARPRDALAMVPRVTAALARLGGDDELEAALAMATAQIAADQGRFDDAQHDAERSLALYRRRFGVDDLRAVEPLRTLAWIALQRDEPARAIPYQTEALAQVQEVLGDDHPEVAATYESIAGAEYLEGEYAKAEEHYLRALAVREHVFGPGHASIANTLHNLGLVYGWEGKTKESVAIIERAVAMDEKLLGAEHPTTLSHLESLALALQTDDRPADAKSTLERALTGYHTLFGPEHPSIAEALHTLALIDLDLHQPAAALTAATESEQMQARLLGSDHDDADLLRTIASAHLALGHPADAILPLEKAHALSAARGNDPGDLAWIDALLGQALYDSGHDRPRARALVRAAEAHMRSDKRMDEQLEALRKWRGTRF